MNESTSNSVPAMAAAETHASDTLWRCRLRDRYEATARASRDGGVSPTDAEKYRWLRGNRGNFAIADALSFSDRDADFDLRIEAAMRLSETGRHVRVGGIGDLPPPGDLPAPLAGGIANIHAERVRQGPYRTFA